MATMAEKLAASGGRPSGFDYLRLALAIGVIAVHSAIVSYNFPGEIALWLSPARPVVRAILPMFFALSGFLVAGSLERSRTLGMFLGLRAIRIYPALAVEALLSALILGPIFTKYTLAGYVHDPLFAHYFWNLIGDPQSMLPGVFAHNPLPDYMNRQLWTVPFELLCYITLAALAVLGVKRRPILLPLAALGIALGYGAIKLWKTGAILYVVGPLPGLLLVVAFLCGVAIYLYRERIPCTPAWFIGAVVASALLLTVVPSGDLFAPFTTAYVAVWLGLTNGPRLWFIRLFLWYFPLRLSDAAGGRRRDRALGADAGDQHHRQHRGGRGVRRPVLDLYRKTRAAAAPADGAGRGALARSRRQAGARGAGPASARSIAAGRRGLIR
jgi:peptidoglycan/LPS O-acetylase OafA/YrhL